MAPGKGIRVANTSWLIIPLLWSCVPTTQASELPKQAREAFQKGLQHLDNRREAEPYFERAASSYRQLRENRPTNSSLYLQEGNAWFLAGDLPRAILAYRQGLVQAPHDPELQRQLAHARDQVLYPSAGSFARPPLRHRPPWLPRWPAVLLVLVLIGYGLACAAVTRWWMLRRRTWLTTAIVLIAAALVPAGALAWEEWQVTYEDEFPLVVISQDDVLLRKGTGEAYLPRYDTPLHRGVEARRRFARGHWLQIQLAGGEVGWVPRGSCLLDTVKHSSFGKVIDKHVNDTRSNQNRHEHD